MSRHQGKIDWDALAPLLDFVFLRTTEGVSSVDPLFAENRAQAACHGLVVGYYHFARPARDAVQQARFFCDQLGALGPGELDPVLDLETTQRGSAPDGWTPVEAAYLQGWAQRFCEAVEERYPGRSIILYTPATFWGEYMRGSPALLGCPLWVADYTHGDDAAPADPAAWEAWAAEQPSVGCAPWAAWSFWQFTSKAVLPGITARMVDANLFAGSIADLRKLARLDAQPPVRT